LVGTDGLAYRFNCHVALQAAKDQRAQFHLAALDVFRSHLRRKSPKNGQDLHREAAKNQEPQGTHCQSAPQLPAISASRQWGSAGRLHAAPSKGEGSAFLASGFLSNDCEWATERPGVFNAVCKPQRK